MSGVIAVSIQILAAVGYGAVAMRALGVLNDMAVGLRISLSFALGLGIIGWLVLPLSVVAGLNDATLGALLGLGILGIVSLLPIKMMAAKESWSTIQLLLGGALLVVLVFDLIEAMAPPVMPTRWRIILHCQNYLLNWAKLLSFPVPLMARRRCWYR